MKNQTILLGLMAGVMASAVQARDVQYMDMTGMVYVRVPFDGAARAEREGLTFGLAAQREIQSGVGAFAPILLATGVRASAPNRGQSFSFDPSGAPSPASLVDIRYTPATGFFSRFTVGGVDALTYRTVHHADGSTSSMPFGLSTRTVIIGAIVGAAIGYGIYAAVDDGEEDDDTNCIVVPGGVICD